jgi:hypothetical protein
MKSSRVSPASYAALGPDVAWQEKEQGQNSDYSYGLHG